ncbi:uncharacterized protein LOC126909092 [Daktulosphaira vitifoliae]|uniref:uncharacterized protein LOC126909092 n=1 Tax=Daktulosphaira vitifoliae TaxID=58002 RepID=UPI0021AA00E2|nr:uncharacterized protein LOC126909092 [Daktulosphaira vitifoliae]
MNHLQTLCGCGMSFPNTQLLMQHCSINKNHRPSILHYTSSVPIDKRTLSNNTFKNNRLTKRQRMNMCTITPSTSGAGVGLVNDGLIQNNGFVKVNSAFEDRVQIFFIKNNSDIDNITEYIDYIQDDIKQLLKDVTSSCIIKFNVVLETTYYHSVHDEVKDVAFKTSNKRIDNNTDFSKIIESMVLKLEDEKDKMEIKNSGWSLMFVDGLQIRVHKYNPLTGGNYIKLPSSIDNRKAVINVQNYNDNMCFKWAVLSKYITGKKNHQRLDCHYTLVEREKNFNFYNIDFPTPINQISRFERNNPTLSINVFALDSKNTVFPLRLTKSRDKNIEHIDLLFLKDSDDNSHYCYIKNFSRLVTKQRSKRKQREYYCKRCLAVYTETP